MTDFSYRLVVLTHGTHGKRDTLEATLASFFEHVSPIPAEIYIHQDGVGAPHYYPGFPNVPIAFQSDDPPIGFCKATRAAWNLAALSIHPHVFWLEHDFVLTRRVALAELAAVLDESPMLAQMALMRDAVNDEEKAVGGLFESRRGQYDPRDETTLLAGGVADPVAWIPRWHEHRSYLTTNPSLMRRSFMQDHPWPEYDDQCEGRFGIDLVEAGFSFGVWGDGSPWCDHIGERSGFGY